MGKDISTSNLDVNKAKEDGLMRAVICLKRPSQEELMKKGYTKDLARVYIATYDQYTLQEKLHKFQAAYLCGRMNAKNNKEITDNELKNKRNPYSDEEITAYKLGFHLYNKLPKDGSVPVEIYTSAMIHVIENIEIRNLINSKISFAEFANLDKDTDLITPLKERKRKRAENIQDDVPHQSKKQLLQSAVNISDHLILSNVFKLLDSDDYIEFSPLAASTGYTPQNDSQRSRVTIISIPSFDQLNQNESAAKMAMRLTGKSSPASQ